MEEGLDTTFCPDGVWDVLRSLPTELTCGPRFQSFVMCYFSHFEPSGHFGRVLLSEFGTSET